MRKMLTHASSLPRLEQGVMHAHAQIALSWHVVSRCSVQKETHDRHLINVTIACAISTLSTLL
jgi:hypothetical protein